MARISRGKVSEKSQEWLSESTNAKLEIQGARLGGEEQMYLVDREHSGLLPLKNECRAWTVTISRRVKVLLGERPCAWQILLQIPLL